ncbi:hypothetical protein KOI35_46955 [Actinoplanes bogorensis]|uniref:Uncharacterized protein n=1 Tax=Paractinoplanes bogorensis TaxID=1610840 RepID=A0ABS5Z5U3_9ACTN|nr:hypothetical protein [Actinoplanes bogorensis]MBU2671060.1 hypothetical protein [Actinoplanes bogorensis]
MTVREPSAQPDIEHPIDLTDLPERGQRPQPARTPEHHPDDSGLPGDMPGPQGPDSPRRE